jgi:hypothetical protein
MVFRTLSSGSRVRLVNAIPHMRWIRVGCEGEVTEIMTSFVEIRWESEAIHKARGTPENRSISLRQAFSYLDCENLEVVQRKQEAAPNNSGTAGRFRLLEQPRRS